MLSTSDGGTVASDSLNGDRNGREKAGEREVQFVT